MLPIPAEIISDNEAHIYHHSEPVPARVSLKVERNSKSINWEISVSNATTPDEAVELYLATLKKLSENLPAS